MLLTVQQYVAESRTSQGVCLSGGADGADLEWGLWAGLAGHGVVHFVFNGHRSRAPQNTRYILSPSALAEANFALRKANQTLRRRYPTSSQFVDSLLQRNFYQIVFAESCYAVSRIDKEGRVAGGTVWAVQMFIDQRPGLPCYVYCQRQCAWFAWDGAWAKLPGPPPSPAGLWAGVGSRELSPAGRLAIQEVLGGAA